MLFVAEHESGFGTKRPFLRRRRVTALRAGALTGMAAPSRTHIPAASALTARPVTSTAPWPARLTLSALATSCAAADSDAATETTSNTLSRTSSAAQPAPPVAAGETALR